MTVLIGTYATLFSPYSRFNVTSDPSPPSYFLRFTVVFTCRFILDLHEANEQSRESSMFSDASVASNSGGRAREASRWRAHGGMESGIYGATIDWAHSIRTNDSETYEPQVEDS